jgi:hypothetical protein
VEDAGELAIHAVGLVRRFGDNTAVDRVPLPQQEMREPREEILDGPTFWVARRVRRYVETDGVSGPLTDTMIPDLYAVAPRALPQQTDTITAKLNA